MEQYKEYCKQLEELLGKEDPDNRIDEETELLTLIIEKWESDHFNIPAGDPIELLHSFMQDHQLKAKNLVEILGVSKGLISDILHYKRGLSKESIRILAAYFKVSQEAFNRPYKLKDTRNLNNNQAIAKHVKTMIP